MKTLRKIWAWLKKHWKWVVGGLLLVVGAIAGYKLARKRPSDPPIGERERKVAFTQGEIAQLEGQKEVLSGKVADAEKGIKETDGKIAAVDKEIADVREAVPKLSDAEKLARLRKLGYR
jgi:peptidoglycan hydrolase CwlO-like protein